MVHLHIHNLFPEEQSSGQLLLYGDYAHGITLQIETHVGTSLALYALNNETMSHRDCVESGMLSLALLQLLQWTLDYVALPMPY